MKVVVKCLDSVILVSLLMACYTASHSHFLINLHWKQKLLELLDHNRKLLLFNSILSLRIVLIFILICLFRIAWCVLLNRKPVFRICSDEGFRPKQKSADLSANYTKTPKIIKTWGDSWGDSCLDHKQTIFEIFGR